MTITNKKLLKNFKAILTSSVSAKEIIASEIDKVDEKYRKLAEAEKADLTEQMRLLDEQIKLYGAFLKDEEAPVAETPVEEEKVMDTIFPENNVEEETEETEQEEVPETVESEESSEDNIWPDDATEEDDADAPAEEATAEDEWPDEPQEW